jgi:Quinolinate phosphoribosyl transferase, N-terminal domain
MSAEGEGPDRSAVLAAVMPDLLSLRPEHDDAVGSARLVAATDGTCAGLVVVKELVGRVGVRCRPLIAEGAAIGVGEVVAELGGPAAAIRAVAPLALTWVTRLSAVASGATPPAAGDELERWASRLSAPAAVKHDGPSFRVEFEG